MCTTQTSFSPVITFLPKASLKFSTFVQIRQISGECNNAILLPHRIRDIFLKEFTSTYEFRAMGLNTAITPYLWGLIHVFRTTSESDSSYYY